MTGLNAKTITTTVKDRRAAPAVMARTKNTPDIPSERILKAIEDYATPDTDGNSITFYNACKINGFDYTTAFERMHNDPNVARAYDRAREARASRNADRLVEISEKLISGKIERGLDLAAARLASDNLKWDAARGDKSRYSEHTTSEQTVKSIDLSALSDAALQELIPLLEGRVPQLPGKG